MAEVISIEVPPDLTKPVSITVDIGKLKPGGKLQVGVSQTNTEQQQVEILVSEVLNKLHTITYSPPTPGIYTFTLRYNSNKVVGSPLKLNLSPPSGKLVSVARPPTGKIKAGQPIEVLFDSFAAGRGEFSATCVGNDTGKIDVSILRHGISNNFSVKFLPPHEDVYILSVFYSNQAVKGSPYTIDLIPVRPDRVQCSNISLPEDRSGPLEVDINTAGCGKAKLNSTCTNEEGKKFPVKIKTVSKDNYHLTVESPPKDDTLTLGITYGGKHVRGSPFIFPGTKPAPSEPDKVKLGKLHVPDMVGDEKIVWVDVDCSEAGVGILTAKCTSKNGEEEEERPVEIVVEELETKDNYRVKFDAKYHARYNLSLLYDSKPIPEGTFEMDILQSPDPTKVQLGELHVPDTAGNGKIVWVDADCSEAGAGVLTAKCTSKNGEEEEIQLDVRVKELEAKNNYHVEFDAENQAKYNLSLFYNGKLVPEGSFEMDIFQLPDPNKVKLGELHVPESTGTEEAWIDVDCSKAGNGKVEAKCTRKNNGEPVNVTISGSGTLSVKFTPESPDIYNLSLFFGGESIPGGEFEVPIPAPDPTKIKLGDLQAPQYAGTEPVTLNVDCSSAGYGTLSAACSLKSNERYKAAISVAETSPPGNYHLEFMPELADLYLLSLYFNGEPVPSGSFEIQILPKPDPAKVIVGSLHTPEYGGDEDAWVSVDCSSAGRGTVLTAECIRKSDESSVEVSIEEMATEGNYHVKFTPILPDNYSLSLFLNGEPIPNGQLKTKILQKPDPARVKLGELHLPSFAGDEDAWIDVDCNGAGDGTLEAECIMKNSSSSSEVSLDPLDPQDSYRVKFTPTVPDEYNLSLFFGGKEIPGGKFAMTIQQRPTPSKIKLGPLHAPKFAGSEPAWVDVDISEAGHGLLTAQCRRENSEDVIDISMEDLTPQGNYRVKFMPLLPGNYILSLFFDDQAIPQGSFEARILQRPDPLKVKLGKLQAPEFAGDAYVWIDVDCTEAGDEILEANCTRRNGNSHEISMEELSPKGNQRVKFAADSPDVYTLSLSFGGMALPNGVFEVNVKSPPDANRVKLGELHVPEFAGKGGEAWLDVDVSQAGIGSLAAECCRRNDENAVEVLVDELVVNETYQVKFTPLQPDTYTLSLSFAGKPVPGGSFEINLPLKPNPEMVRFGELYVPEFAGAEMGWVDVDCSNAGHGTLTAKCVLSDQDIPVKVEMEETISKDHYRVHFSATDPGNYTLSLFFADEPISNGNFEMHIPAKPDASRVKLATLHVPESHGEEELVWIDADCSEAGHGKLAAQCWGKNRERGLEVSLERLSSKDLYRVKFNPKQPDIYTLSLFFAGESIPDGVFEINLHPKSCAKMVKHLGTFVPEDIAEPVVLKFDASKAGPGEMRGRVTGITQAGMVSSRVDLIDEVDVIYELFFIPEGGDMYNVDVYWSNESIPGSPIYVKIAYPSEVVLSDLVHADDFTKPVQLSIDTSSAGPGVLTASCAGSSSGSHHAAITQDQSRPTKFNVSFRPTVPDLYWLHVYFNDTEIKKSPMEIDLRPPPSPSPPSLLPVDEQVAVAPLKNQSMEYGINTDFMQDDHTDKPNVKPPNNKFQLYIGEPMTLTVENTEGSPTATAFGEQTGESTISITQDHDSGSCQVKFQPQQPDTYTVVVRVKDKHIPGSPYVVEYVDREPDDSEENQGGEEQRYKIDIGGCESEDEVSKTPTRMQMYVGDPMTMLVENVEVKLKDLSASVVGERTGKGIISVNSTEKNGSFKIEFNPDEPDTYTIAISHFNSGIPGSPFIVDYIEREPVKDKQEPIKDDQEVEPAISPVQEQPVVSSPNSVVAFDECVPEHPIHRPYLIKCVGGQKDLKSMEAYAVHDDSCIREILRIRRGQGKKPLLVFYPKRLGLHWIHVKHNSKEIAGSPFKLKIIKSSCRIVSVPTEAYVGDLVEIKIDASEAGEGDLNILATVPVGGKGTSFSHTDNGQGVYTIMFTPKVPGRHKVKVKWAGEVIPNSPISVRVSELTEEMKVAREAASKVFIVKEEDSRQIPSKLTHFDVNTEKAGRGELSIRSRGPTTPKINVYHKDNGLYSCHVMPAVSGRYEIEILWNGIPIPGNPYKIDFITDKSYIISDLDLETEKFVLGQPCDFLVNCGKNEGSFNVSAMPQESANIYITPLKNNIYSVKIIPQVSGNHEISVKYSDQHVLKSPYHVQFEAPDRYAVEGRVSRLSELNLSFQDTTASTMAIPSESLERIADATEWELVKAKGPGLVEGVVGQEGNFSIDTNGAGNGKLEVLVQGPRGSFQTKLRRHPDNERTLLARYDPTHIGKYTISILWNGRHIDSSPFVVSVRRQEQNSG